MDIPFVVLLIEPEDLEFELLEQRIRFAGLTCRMGRIRAVDNLAATLSELKPNVIVCEFQMPDFFGLEVLRACRSISPDVPFIFIADRPRQFDIDVVKRLGAMALVDRADRDELPVALRRAVNIALEKSTYRSFRASA